jgi:hypothetical protein
VTLRLSGWNRGVRRVRRRTPPDHRTDGTAAERRTLAAAGIAEITRIAESAPTIAERDAALEMNHSLTETIEALDDEAAEKASGTSPQAAVEPAAGATRVAPGQVDAARLGGTHQVAQSAARSTDVPSL